MFQECVCSVGGVRFEVVQKLVSQISVLSQHVIKVSQAFLTRLSLIVNFLVHLIAFIINVRHNLFFIGSTGLLFFNQTVFDAFQLHSDRV